MMTSIKSEKTKILTPDSCQTAYGFVQVDIFLFDKLKNSFSEHVKLIFGILWDKALKFLDDVTWSEC